MKGIMVNALKHLFTARDNSTYSLTKVIAIAGSGAMIYNFIKVGSIDFQGLGIGVSTVIAALAAKYYTEKKDA